MRRRPARTIRTPTRPRPCPSSRSRSRGVAAVAGGGSGSGLPGFLKFLIFALVLAAIVLAVALTALRPMVSGAIMGIAEDNPAALRLPFVRDIVAENLGTALTAPASTDPVAGRVPRRGGRHRAIDRGPPRGAGLPRRQPRVRVHRHRPEPDRRAPAGHVHPAQEPDTRPARQRPPGAAQGPVRRHRPADGPPARADHGQARDVDGAPDGPRRVLPDRRITAGRAAQRLSVAPDDPQGRPEGRLARRLPVAGDLPRAPRHDTRRARPADARQVLSQRGGGTVGGPGRARA